MTASYSICGQKVSEENLCKIILKNDTIALMCQMVRKRLKNSQENQLKKGE